MKYKKNVMGGSSKLLQNNPVYEGFVASIRIELSLYKPPSGNKDCLTS